MRKLLVVEYINLMCDLVGIWGVYVRPSKIELKETIELL